MSIAPEHYPQPDSPDPRLLRARAEPAPVLQRLIDGGWLPPKARVLCYGCGRGADVAWLRLRKYDVTGYDPYPAFGYQTRPTGQYEAVLLIYLLARLRDPGRRARAVAEAARHVRPGGTLILATRDARRLAPGAENMDAVLAAWRALLPEEAFVDVGHLPTEPDSAAACCFAERGGTHMPQRPSHFIDQADEAARIWQALRQRPLLGLDVETTLEEPRDLCTVQLADQEANYVFDMLAFDDWSGLKTLLEDAASVKVIHNAYFEEQVLRRYGIRIHNIYDTLHASRKARKGEGGSHKLGDVCERELGVYLDKREQVSDWTRRPLSPGQLAYAALDAEVLIDLHAVFHPPPPPSNMELFG